MLRTLGPILVVIVAVGVVAGVPIADYLNANKALLALSHPDSYDSSSRGLPDGNATHVSVSYTVVDVRNPEQDLLEVAGWLALSWTDKRLAWNPEEREGIEKLYVDRKRIWVPDITVFVQALPTERTANRLVVYSSGAVLWVPQEFWKVSCPALLTDKEYFNCSIKFGSWIYDAGQVNISASVADEIYAKNRTNLNVTAISVTTEVTKYDCCPNTPYQSNKLVISLHRKADETRGKKGWKHEKKEKRRGDLPDAVEGLTEQIKDLVEAVGDLAEKP